MPRTPPLPLSPAEQQAVVRHLPLVRLQLGRQLRRATALSRRERDDLFQEGCIALAAAVRSHRPDGRTAFPAYALARIHHAMGLWLAERGTAIRVPNATQKRRRRRPAARDRHDPFDARCSYRCAPLPRQLPAPEVRPRQAPTIGEAMRDRMTRALEAVAADDNETAVAQRLIQERLLIAEPSQRTPLRAIGRDSGTSLTSVTRREARLRSEAREWLLRDPAFRYLERLRRHRPEGLDEELAADEQTRLDRAALRAGRRARFGRPPRARSTRHTLE